MQPSFELSITSVTTVAEMPDTWSEDRYRALLTHLDYDDAAGVPAADLRSYVTMTLQDLDQQDAAKALLAFSLGDDMTPGKLQHLSEEMMVDRCWEESPDLEHHERLFNAQVLLNEAHSDTPQPEINQIEATFAAANEAAEKWLKENCATAPAPFLPKRLLVRCIAGAMPDGAILNRLFDDQINGAEFTEAEYILWRIQAALVPAEGARGSGYQVSLYSPLRWTGDLEEGQSVTCETFLGA